ncbi:MAG: isocitrate lyase/phosphoenolpyruvate mutase family protein, partial [Planctomycetota bacterium]
MSVDRFCQIVREVADGSGLPVIADADTGFGEEEMTRRTVIAYSRAGAAGLHIEDQVFPKRCGHLDGKELLPLEDAASKVRWAAEAATELGNGMLVCARTDARGVTGMEEAITRAKAYVAAGADMIFPEGLRTEGEFAIFAEKLNALGDQRPYVLANMTEFGKTPIIPLERFEQMGYSLVIYPVTTLRIAMAAVTEALDEL